MNVEHRVNGQFTNSEVSYILKQCSDRGLNEDEMKHVNNAIAENIELKKEISDMYYISVGDNGDSTQISSLEENLFLNFRALMDFVSSIYSPERSEFNSILTKASIRHNKNNKNKYVMNTELLDATKNEEFQLQQLRDDMEEMVQKIEKYVKLAYIQEEGNDFLSFVNGAIFVTIRFVGLCA